MPSRFFIKRNGKVIGPFSPDAVKDRIGTGKIRVTDQIGSAGDGPWKAIDSIPGLAKLFEPLLGAEPFDDLPDTAWGYDASQLPARRKKRKQRGKHKETPTGDHHPSEFMDEETHYREKRAALDALPGLSMGIGQGNTGSLIIGALLYGIISMLCCGMLALIPMLFMGFRVWLVRENTSALIIYVVAGFIASGLGFLCWQFIFYIDVMSK